MTACATVLINSSAGNQVLIRGRKRIRLFRRFSTHGSVNRRTHEGSFPATRRFVGAHFRETQQQIRQPAKGQLRRVSKVHPIENFSFLSSQLRRDSTPIDSTILISFPGNCGLPREIVRMK